MRGRDYKVTYLDGNTVHSSGVIKKSSSMGFTIGEASKRFEKDHPNCRVLRIECRLSESMISTFDDRGQVPTTGLGFDPKE